MSRDNGKRIKKHKQHSRPGLKLLPGVSHGHFSSFLFLHLRDVTSLFFTSEKTNVTQHQRRLGL
jgi:hypothetical protein